ncbi:hypothetical protein [Thauera sp.]|uniref:hypothetical protein n=1 Tax=Thauera sp. TaxID=1905334 RepID=UPI002C4051DE|nr:hypothetical protein [Thauera sp.]HRP25367.1 hypothetical protein [Thauera sp.]
MPTPRLPPERRLRLKEALEAALRDGYQPFRQSGRGRGSSAMEAARRAPGETRGSVERFIRTEETRAARGEPNYLPDWSLFALPSVAPAAPASPVRRYILTSAQDDTDVHKGFLANLRVYAARLNAEILIGGFTYQKALYTDHTTRTALFREELQPYMRFESVDLGPVLFAAEMNTLPTADRPLSGLQTYGRGKSVVFPHAKIALEAVPSMPGTHPPIVMTTGAVTEPNYIPKKAGLKAEFHHVLGATVVEVDPVGNHFWARSVSADRNGDFQDLDVVVSGGVVRPGNRVAAITWGDIHCPSVEPAVLETLWSESAGSMIEALRPQVQVFHDLMSFEMTSRHVDGDAIHRAQMVYSGRSSIEGQVAQGAQFLRATERPWCRSVVVESNHDERLLRWARRDIDRNDTENVAYWHAANLALLLAAKAGDEDFNLVRHCLRSADERGLDTIDFIPVGGSMVICQDSGGIEIGMHGHAGPNGARGTPTGFARMASRLTIGHMHAPQIHDGVYIAGITGALDQGYNRGPGAWLHAHVVHYANGKRTLIIQSEDGRWRP